MRHQHISRLAEVDIAATIAEIRSDVERYGITLRKLAMVSGVDHTTILRLLTGDRPNPSADTLVAICRGMEVIRERNGLHPLAAELRRHYVRTT